MTAQHDHESPDTKAESHKSVRQRIHLNDISHPAIHHFVSLVDCATVLDVAIKNVHKYLYSKHGKPPGVRSVTLVLERMGGVAWTDGINLDDMHKEIHMSLDYIAHNIGDPTRFRDECIGVITHEMVHCWQHDCKGSAPGGLIEGMADYVRLKSGLAPPHWKSPKEEHGERWDEGYQKTAFFLEWIGKRYKDDPVGRINAAMAGKPYKQEVFWNDLFGESVDAMWKKYVTSLKRSDNLEIDSKESNSEASTEPELVDLDDDEKAKAEGKILSQGSKKAKEFRA